MRFPGDFAVKYAARLAVKYKYELPASAAT